MSHDKKNIRTIAGRRAQQNFLVGGVMLVIIVLVVMFISKKGIAGTANKEVGGLLSQTDDADGDGIPNFQDKCCPEQCTADKDELEEQSPTDERYGCSPWQTPTSCKEATTDCGLRPGQAPEPIPRNPLPAP